MITQIPELESGFVHFAAMGNYMNRDVAMRHVKRIENAPVTNPQLVKVCESACQRLRLDLIVVFRKPLDFIYNPFCNRIIELGKIFKRLRRELNVIIQVSFSLSLTSWSVIRSVEPRDSSSLALISSVNSRC